MSLGQSMMNWLRSVDKDQNLQGIENLTSTSMSDRVRRWFRRQDLTPTLDTGYYNPATEKYVLGPAPLSLGDAASVVTTTLVDVVSSNEETLTCAAGHAYKVIVAELRNTNRAPTVRLIYTPSGGTAVTLQTTTVGGADCTSVALGGNTVAATGVFRLNGPLWMQAGDTLQVLNINFVAADVMHKSFIYEDYTL